MPPVLSYALQLQRLDVDIRQVNELIEVHEHQLQTVTDEPARFGHQQELTDLRELLTLLEQEHRELAQKHHIQPVYFVHGYSLPKIWAEREHELYRLQGEIMSNRYSILAIIAMGGTGKSALARRVLDEISKQATLFDGILWFNFYAEPSFDRFLVECCRYLAPDFNPVSYPSPYAKIVLVRHLLESSRYLLVMDGIEMLQVDDPNRADYGSFRDLALRDFLQAVCQQTASQILVTSRWKLTDLASEARYHEEALGKLQDQAAINFMQQQGVKGDKTQLTAIVQRYNNHPLTLYILADYLKSYFEGDVSQANQLVHLPEGTPQGILLQSILDGYWTCLTPEERYFMTRLAAFRGGVLEDALQVLARKNHYSPIFQGLLQHLAHTALVNIEQAEDGRYFTAHALVKTYFYERMGQEEQRKTHVALKNYAEGKPLPQQIHTLNELEPLLEACYHCIKAGLYKEAFNIFAGRELIKPLLHLCQYDRALEIILSLINAAQAESATGKLSLSDLSWLQNSAALMFSSSGRLQHALVHYRSALAITELLEEWDNVVISMLNLADLMMYMGRLNSAYEMLQKVDELVKAHKSLRLKVEDVYLGRLGRYYALLGEGEKARKTLAEAVTQSIHLGNQRALCICHIWQAEFYLDVGELYLAMEVMEKALKIAERQQYVDYQGNALKTAGDIQRLAYNFPEALQRYQAALAIAENVGYRLLQVEVLLGLAKLNQDLGDSTGANVYALQTLRYANESGAGLHQVQAHIILGQLALKEGNRVSAQSHLVEARQYEWETLPLKLVNEITRLESDLAMA